MTARSLLLLLAVLALSTSATFAQEPTAAPLAKSKLRILLVGHDPAAPTIRFADADDERVVTLYKERTSAFTELLRARFEQVAVVYAADYRAEQSDQMDVTVFDALPKPLQPAKRGTDPETGERFYEPAVYLPKSFDRATLMVGQIAPAMSDGLGLKLDWL
ncbi:MAG: hypothetical protein AAF581_06060 [Planctomycetota bacterium]